MSDIAKNIDEVKHCHTKWEASSHNLIEALLEIQNIIQGEENKHRVGKIVYSIIGTGSGAATIAGIVAAPFTLGGSLVLSIIGGAMGIATAGAGVTHAFVKEGIIAKQIRNAEEEIKKHQKDCELLSNALTRFGSKIRKILPFVNESGKCVSLGLSIQKLACSSTAMHHFRSGSSIDKVMNVFKTGENIEGIIKPSTKAIASAKIFGVLAAAGIIIDIATIVYNAHKLHCGISHDKARQIGDIIHTIKREKQEIAEDIYRALNNEDVENYKQYRHNQGILNKAKPGDLIKFQRRGIPYSHWAVYKGDSKVIHFTKVGNKLEREEADFWEVTLFYYSFIRLEILKKMSEATIENNWDNKYKALEPQRIIDNALTGLGKHPYHLFEENCEHFATWCRYGISISDQGQTVEDVYVAANTTAAGLRAIGSLSLTIANIVK